MTDEEKAKEYADECFKGNDKDSQYYRTILIKGYLDGLTEGKKEGYEQGYEDCRHYAHDYYKPKWHDLRKDPNDLPKDNEYVLIYTDLKNTYVARKPTGKDYFIARTGGFIQGLAIIAWCELPKFKE